MKVDWSTLMRLPQTYVLIVGAIAGYLGLVAWVGPRPLVLLGGGGVGLTMVAGWTSSFRVRSRTQDSSDLLVLDVFLQHLKALESNVPKPDDEPWRQAWDASLASQNCAIQIAQHDSLLHADLLEAVHSILDLMRQIADALQLSATVQTPMYQEMVQEKLQLSCDRLQQSYQQLQQLQDQVALASLETDNAAFPQRLQQLIAANQHILNSQPVNDDSLQ